MIAPEWAAGKSLIGSLSARQNEAADGLLRHISRPESRVR
jgi:hypothetical protein